MFQMALQFEKKKKQSPGGVIIGLIGRAGSGKDTVANRLVAEHGFRAISIAAPLKDAASVLFDIDRHVMDDRQLKETIDLRYGLTPRHLLQHMGTEYIRSQFSEDFLIKRALQGVSETDKVVITDVRFDNEAHGVMNTPISNAQLWNISADQRLRGETCLDEKAAQHVSEQPLSLDMYSVLEVDNNGTMDDLYRKVDAMVTTF